MKSKIINVIAFAAYWLGVDTLFYWLNRKAKRILTFHNVLPDSMFRDGVANGVSNRLSDFIRIVDECGKKFRFTTDLFDAKTLTITFDDGYHNQYSVAFDALRKRGVSAYLFLAGDVGKVLTIDKLLHWVAEVPVEYIPSGDRLRYWVDEVWPRFMANVDKKGLSVFAALDAVYPYNKVIANLPEDYIKERLEGVSEKELSEMHEAGWKIGWHTKSHYPLAKFNNYELMQELDSAAEFKEVCLSYPYGNPVEVGEEAIKVAELLGYPCAVSNTNEGSHIWSRYFLPRMTVSHDKYRLHMQLSGLEYFLRHRKLLPMIKGEPR